MGVRVQYYSPTDLSPGKNPGTYWVGERGHRKQSGLRCISELFVMLADALRSTYCLFESRRVIKIKVMLVTMECSIRADFTDISAIPTGIFPLELIVVRGEKFV